MHVNPLPAMDALLMQQLRQAAVSGDKAASGAAPAMSAPAPASANTACQSGGMPPLSPALMALLVQPPPEPSRALEDEPPPEPERDGAEQDEAGEQDEPDDPAPKDESGLSLAQQRAALHLQQIAGRRMMGEAEP